MYLKILEEAWTQGSNSVHLQPIYTNTEFSVQWIQNKFCSKYTGWKSDKSHPCARFRYIKIQLKVWRKLGHKVQIWCISDLHKYSFPSGGFKIASAVNIPEGKGINPITVHSLGI